MILKARCVVVDHFIGAKFSDQLHLSGRDRSNHVGTVEMGKLHGKDAHRASTALHQNPLTRLGLRQLDRNQRWTLL
jgi:hypothetical protein